jgi:membrane fusion protein
MSRSPCLGTLALLKLREVMFRKEVSDALQGAAASSEIALALPYRLFAWAAGLFLVAILLLMSLGSYARHELVSGELEPLQGAISIIVPNAGTVTRVWVAEGDQVLRDQPLFEISSDVFTSALGSNKSATALGLQELRARLQSELKTLALLQKQQHAELTGQEQNLRAEIQMLRAQLVIAKKQFAQKNQTLARLAPLLQKGLISQLQFDEKQAEVAALEADTLRIQSAQSEKTRQIAESKGQYRQLPLLFDSKRSELNRALAEVELRVSTNESERAIVIRASDVGVISNLVVRAGQSLAAGAECAKLLPSGPLQARLWLSSRAVGFVRDGDTVLLKYHAFPFQKFGIQRGVVRQASAVPFAPDETLKLFGRELAEPMYRVTVALEQQDFSEGAAKLKPGMRLDAEIVLERRYIYEWIFAPIYGLRARG